MCFLGQKWLANHSESYFELIKFCSKSRLSREHSSGAHSTLPPMIFGLWQVLFRLWEVLFRLAMYFVWSLSREHSSGAHNTLPPLIFRLWQVLFRRAVYYLVSEVHGQAKVWKFDQKKLTLKCVPKVCPCCQTSKKVIRNWFWNYQIFSKNGLGH